MQGFNARQQCVRERSFPWSDFNDLVIRSRIKLIDNARDYAAVTQKVLSEAFAMAVAWGHRFSRKDKGSRRSLVIV